MIGALIIIVVAFVLIAFSQRRQRDLRRAEAQATATQGNFKWPAEAYIGGIKNFSDMKKLETAINDRKEMWARIDFDENLAYLMFREQDPAKQEALLTQVTDELGFTVERFVDMDEIEERLDEEAKSVASPTQLAQAERAARLKDDPLERWKR